MFTVTVFERVQRATYDAAAAACTGDGCSSVEEEDAFDPRSECSFAATFELSDASKGPTSDEPDVSLHAIKQKASYSSMGERSFSIVEGCCGKQCNARGSVLHAVAQIVPHTAAFNVHLGLIIVISVFLRHIPGLVFSILERFGRWEYHSFHGTLCLFFCYAHIGMECTNLLQALIE